MKYYAMATIANPSITKQPLKFIEIPLNKFAEEVIPFHQKMLQAHKNNVQKLMSINNTAELLKEIKDKKRSIRQVRDLLYELDTLRTQVQDSDLDQFDIRTMPLRNALLKLTKGYQDLEKLSEKLLIKLGPEEQTLADRQNPFEGVSQIHIEGNIEDLKLKHEQEKLDRVQDIQRDADDLHEVYKELHSMVNEQGEVVTRVEMNVDTTQENVNSGLRHLIEAHKIKSVAYPATGAFIGTLVAGPIGLLAGLKVGGIAAVGCALAGYTGGIFLKKHKHLLGTEPDAVINNENNENHTVTETMKKDI
ncbi:syntaxin-17 [Cylas formicarius]|uniref:syntaxin-17 n=1 Tax=Cylas formicarius TaxID=197179 RepID=UPI002958AB86|nr:syntaxin-17 [Cylas formicarius]